MDQSAHVITARSLSKRFGDLEALRDLDLEVTSGECFGFLGPNGAGKSTFIGMIYGVVRRTSGSLMVFGKDPDTSAAAIKRCVGVVTQDNALDESLTVFENMMLYAGFEGVRAQEARSRILELLEYMNLAHKKDVPILSLSGGMKRRLVFVRALLARPQLLILDEPTTGLDPAVRHLLWGKVRELREAGTTILLTTHYMHEAELLCDRLAIMDGGRTVGLGSPRELIARHSPGYMALFEPSALAVAKSLAALHPSLDLHQDESVVGLRAPDLAQLTALCAQSALTPQILRPANLEDVFLKLTGRGLSDDA
jgi:lipooligosaccharide transport system ATP-binding protein